MWEDSGFRRLGLPILVTEHDHDSPMWRQEGFVSPELPVLGADHLQALEVFQSKAWTHNPLTAQPKQWPLGEVTSKETTSSAAPSAMTRSHPKTSTV